MRRRIVLLAWAASLPPVLGGALAQALMGRIAENSAFTAALVHALASSIFAILLLASAVINATIITLRSADAPTLQSGRSVRIALVILLVLEAGWVACVAIGDAAGVAEPATAGAIAVASCVVLGFAARRDPGEAAARQKRLDAVPPAQRRRSRLAALAVAGTLVLGVLAVDGVLGWVPLHHRDCEVTGSSSWSSRTPEGTVTSRSTVETSCGDFAYDPATVDEEALLYPGEPLDITTLGFRLGPPALRLVTFEPTAE